MKVDLGSVVLPKVLVKVDKSEYVPTVTDDHGAIVARIAPDGNGFRFRSLTSRTHTVVDTGMNISVPKGWKMGVEPLTEWSLRGMILTDVTGEDGRVKVVVSNLGKEIFCVKDGETIGRLWFYPTHQFTFDVKESDV
jgi:dUTPase